MKDKGDLKCGERTLTIYKHVSHVVEINKYGVELQNDDSWGFDCWNCRMGYFCITWIFGLSVGRYFDVQITGARILTVRPVRNKYNNYN